MISGGRSRTGRSAAADGDELLSGDGDGDELDLSGERGAGGAGVALARHLSNTPRVLFFAEPDQDVNADEELANVGRGQAQADYFYRHGSGGSLLAPPSTEHIKLAGLGKNSDGLFIRAIAMDANFIATPGAGGVPRVHADEPQAEMGERAVLGRARGGADEWRGLIR